MPLLNSPHNALCIYNVLQREFAALIGTLLRITSCTCNRGSKSSASESRVMAAATKRVSERKAACHPPAGGDREKRETARRCEGGKMSVLFVNWREHSDFIANIWRTHLFLCPLCLAPVTIWSKQNCLRVWLLSWQRRKTRDSCLVTLLERKANIDVSFFKNVFTLISFFKLPSLFSLLIFTVI